MGEGAEQHLGKNGAMAVLDGLVRWSLLTTSWWWCCEQGSRDYEITTSSSDTLDLTGQVQLAEPGAFEMPAKPLSDEDVSVISPVAVAAAEQE
jgi:hypothetical protein